MSPLNRGPMMARGHPAMRPPMPRFDRVPPPFPPVMGRGMPPRGNPMFGPRPRSIPLPPPPRPGPMMARLGGPPVPPPPPMFGHRSRPMPQIPPPMGMRGPIGPRGPMIRPGPRGTLPPHVLPHMRPRFPPNHVNVKGKINNAKKNNKLQELELKKPWMTDEIRIEIQKKNKLYAKAKKNKGAKEWEEFKDLRNKVTRMIRDAKNEYLAKNPEKAQVIAEKNNVEKDCVQKTENTTEQTELTERNGENKPSSEQAHLYENDDALEENDNDDDIDELYSDSDKESSVPYCEVCDRDFHSEELLEAHIQEHQTCKIDGCKFTAHPKIVEKHISMQHCTGLYQRMKHATNEEDIEKWISERKRRYPTAVNVKMQEAEQLEKEKRGEVIKLNHQTLGSSKREQLRKNRKRKRNKRFQMKIAEEIVEREVYRGLLPFAGTALLDEKEQSDNSSVEEPAIPEISENCKFEVSDEDEQTFEQPTICEPKIDEVQKLKTVIPQILSLVADYGSDSDNDEPPDEVPTKVSKIDVNDLCQQPEPKTKSEDPQLNTIIKENTSTSIDDKKTQPKLEKKSFKDKQPNKSSRSNNLEFSNGKLRLLNKLLARSIQHERNVICQCITFVANNKFFE